MIANLFGLLIFGSLIMLGIILIANPLRVNPRANVWFGLFLFLWASFWVDEILFISSGGTIVLGPVFLLNFVQFLTPVLFYISICYFTDPEYRLGKNVLIFLIAPFLYLALFFLDRRLSADLQIVLTAMMPLHGLVYSFLSLFLIRSHKRHIEQFSSSTHDIDLSWILYIVIAVLFLVIGIIIFNVLFFEAPLNLFMNGLVYLIVLFTAYHSLKQKEIFPTDNEERAQALLVLNESDTDVLQTRIISDDRMVELKAQLYDLLTKEELYLDSELNLGKLAKKLNISSHQLSYVINNGYNQNFYGFINKFRVEKAKKLLANKELDKYSIIAIAFESGFNSKTSFNTTFKKIAGQTPSEYKKTSSDL